MNEPRNWKWIVPAMFCPLFVLAGTILLSSNSKWMDGAAFVLFAWAFIMFVAALRNHSAYFNLFSVEAFERRQAALAVTADSLMLEKAQGVHPKVLEQLFNDRRRALMLVAGTDNPSERPYAVLYADPSITEMFVGYVLDNSTPEKIMPMHGHLVEGRVNVFDPRGEVDEYTMYRRFEALLIQRRMLTKPYGDFSPGLWIPPWGPQSVADIFGLQWEPPTKSNVNAIPHAPWEVALDDLEKTEMMR